MDCFEVVVENSGREVLPGKCWEHSLTWKPGLYSLFVF